MAASREERSTKESKDSRAKHVISSFQTVTAVAGTLVQPRAQGNRPGLTHVTGQASLPAMIAVVEARIDRVVVHPGAAQVTRIGAVDVTARHQVRIAGLPAALEDDSVQIAMTGPGRAVDIRIAVEVVDPAEPTPRHAEVMAARRAAAAVDAERGAVATALEALAGLAPVAPEDRDGVRPAWGDVVAARLQIVELARDRAVALRAALADLDREREVARQALLAAEERFARRSSAELPAGAVTKAVIITVEPDGAGGGCALRCSYRVDGARWAPTYVARLDDGAVRLELRAAIAQATGEDWSQVAIELSTAAPGRRLELPELAALRIGRAQARPARAGWRPPPIGVDDLYRDWDRAFARRPNQAPTRPPLGGLAPSAPPPPPRSVTVVSEPMASRRSRVVEHDDARAEESAAAPPAPGAMPAMMVTQQMAAAPQKKAPMKTFAAARGGGGTRPAEAAPSEAPLDDGPIVARVDLLAFGQLVLAGPRQPGRGTLQRQGDDHRWSTAPAIAQAVHRAAATAGRRVQGLTLPTGLRAPAPGVYDYAFVSDGRLDVPADGAWHQVAVAAHAAPVAITHVVAPAIAPEVYRVATLTNPLDAPLLAGPVDVYERGELVITATIDETPPGGAVAIGLGVDPVVKTARNVRYREEVAGVLRGSLKLVHDVTVDVDNLGPRAIQLEIRERVPIPAPDLDDLEVAIDRVTPMWEPWRPEPRPGEPALRGGYRWQIAVAPGERKALRVEYAIKIASKHELVGGNRREP